jgi:hypothetical protein
MSDHDNIPTTEAPLAANAKAYSLPSPEIHIDFNNNYRHTKMYILLRQPILNQILLTCMHYMIITLQLGS